MSFLNPENIHDVCKKGKGLSRSAAGEKLACMRHILVSLDTTFHCQPTALEDMRAPEIPIRIRKCFPINFSVIMNIERVNPDRTSDDEKMAQMVKMKLTCALR